MSIWLRSQDKKKLVEAKDIAVVEYWKGNSDKYECVISVYGGDGDVVAHYPTEARALEVMDEIEHFIGGEEKKRLELQGRALTSEWLSEWYNNRLIERAARLHPMRDEIVETEKIYQDAEKALERYPEGWYWGKALYPSAVFQLPRE